MAQSVLNNASMGRPLRLFEPDGIYFITGRCLQGRLLLRPSTSTNKIIGGVLAKAIHKLGVDVFAFAFTSNHFHMLVRSHSLSIPAFMQYLRSNIAKQVGAEVDWRGKFWDRRYDAEAVIDDDALIGRLRYILAHGVKERLVRRCCDWPGLTSHPELLGNTPRAFAWPAAKGSNSAEQTLPLTLAVLPPFESMNENQRTEHIRVMEKAIEEENDSTHGPGVLGCKRILRQHPHAKPQTLARRRRPLCHSSTREGYLAYREKYREFAAAYRAASQLRSISVEPEDFPVYSYRPPWMRPCLGRSETLLAA